MIPSWAVAPGASASPAAISGPASKPRSQGAGRCSAKRGRAGGTKVVSKAVQRQRPPPQRVGEAAVESGPRDEAAAVRATAGRVPPPALCAVARAAHSASLADRTASADSRPARPTAASYSQPCGCGSLVRLPGPACPSPRAQLDGTAAALAAPRRPQDAVSQARAWASPAESSAGAPSVHTARVGLAKELSSPGCR